MRQAYLYYHEVGLLLRMKPLEKHGAMPASITRPARNRAILASAAGIGRLSLVPTAISMWHAASTLNPIGTTTRQRYRREAQYLFGQ